MFELPSGTYPLRVLSIALPLAEPLFCNRFSLDVAPARPAKRRVGSPMDFTAFVQGRAARNRLTLPLIHAKREL